MIKTPAQIIRARSRKCLLGHYPQAISGYLTMVSLDFVIYYMCTSFANSEDIWGRALYIILNILYLLIAFILTCGFSFMSLKFCAGQNAGASDVIQAFRYKAGTCTGVFMFILLMCALCFSPLLFFATVLSDFFRHSTVMVILSFLLCVGIVLAVYVLLTFSQVYFIIWDYPDYGFKRILKTSQMIMRGNRLRLFYLWAGFIPLNILCLMTFGIGYLWLGPYYRTTLAQFYLDTVNNYKPAGNAG